MVGELPLFSSVISQRLYLYEQWYNLKCLHPKIPLGTDPTCDENKCMLIGTFNNKGLKFIK